MNLTKKKELLVKELESLPEKTCPYVEWYKFKRCGITTCKNHSKFTSSCCIDLDRVKPSGSKIITDAELHNLKFKDRSITTRLVSLERKKAVDQVKYMVVLHKFLLFIETKYEDQGELSPLVVGKYVQRAQVSDPLKIKKLRFKNWMWAYLVDSDVYQEFIEEQNGGECASFKIHQLLRITPLKYEKILMEIKLANEVKQQE